MSRYHSYLNSASQILHQYNGEIPFAQFLKKFFADNKKFGSKDRKQVSNLCYCFYRLGKAVMNVSLEEKILIALFLCSNHPNEILEALKPEWNKHVQLSPEKKLSLFNLTLSFQYVFPYKDELSENIDLEKFNQSFFIQPDLFIRLRPGKEDIVKLKLKKEGIEFESISTSCLALPNASKIDGILELDKEAIIQDYSSQQTGRFFSFAFAALQNDKPMVWDCCAGSGGKSIMAYDINPEIELTVSDMRESILANLKKRFDKAGIKKYKSLLFDLTERNIQHSIINNQFSIIMADVPCTGSGTWSRTPEQLYFFEETKIDVYASLQKKIVANVIPHLKPGGFLLYITCSVFKKENEEIIDYCKEKFNLQTLKTEVLKGYEIKADTMFVALLQSPESA